jgi:hypothetical protein
MKRRTFLALVSGSLLVAPLAVEAQQAGKVYRIGVLELLIDSKTATAPRRHHPESVLLPTDR